MSEFIAVEGMTVYEADPNTHPSDICGTGSWQKISLVITNGNKITVDDKKTELMAVGTFQYVGGTVPGPPSGTCSTPSPLSPINEIVTLMGTSNSLKDAGQKILREGDEATGIQGPENKVYVDSGQTKLKSA